MEQPFFDAHPASSLLLALITSLLTNFCLLGSGLPFPTICWRSTTGCSANLVCSKPNPSSLCQRIKWSKDHSCSSSLNGIAISVVVQGCSISLLYFLPFTYNQLTSPLDWTLAVHWHLSSLLHYSFMRQIFISCHLDYGHGLRNGDSLHFSLFLHYTPLVHRFQVNLPRARRQMGGFSCLKPSMGFHHLNL